MRNFRSLIINLLQKYNRRINSAYLEHVYQINYLDLARRTDWLIDVPMSSPSGGTASFSLLYVLLTVLRDKELNTIMELGAGQSTGLLVQYAENHKKSLVSVDDDEYWLQLVAKKSQYVTPVYAKLTPTVINNLSIDWYACKPPSFKIDLLLIDGPMAYKRKIKYNRLGVLKWLPEILNDEFIIIVDDVNRAGENALVNEIIKKFDQHHVLVKTRKIVGGNSQTIFATEKYFKYLYL